MSKFNLQETHNIDVEVILSRVKDIKDLLNIEFSDNDSNIILLKEICIALYHRITELESEVASLKGRRQ
jgi:hypothetical protein